MRSLTLLNSYGDVTIMWGPENDAAIEAIIAKKMQEGVTFFIVEPVAGGLMPPRRTALEEPEQAHKSRALSIADEDLEAFVGAGKGTLVQAAPGTRRKTVKRAKDPKEVASSSSVAIKPRAGG
jgi:hypothetical protein